MDERDLELYRLEVTKWSLHYLRKEVHRLRVVSAKWKAVSAAHGFGASQVADAENMLGIVLDTWNTKYKEIYR